LHIGLARVGMRLVGGSSGVENPDNIGQLILLRISRLYFPINFRELPEMLDKEKSGGTSTHLSPAIYTE
jgi:hypothetical protein